MTARATIALVTAAAIALAGCGSSSKGTTSTAARRSATTSTSSAPATTSTSSAPAKTSTGTTPTKKGAVRLTQLDAGFIGRVNAVCRRANAEITRRQTQFPFKTFDPVHPGRTQLPRVAAFLKRAQPIADRVPGELARLHAPAKGFLVWKTLLQYATQARALADRQITAAQASDVPGFVKAVRETKSTDAIIGRLAVTGGFGTSSPCNQVL